MNEGSSNRPGAGPTKTDADGTADAGAGAIDPPSGSAGDPPSGRPTDATRGAPPPQPGEQVPAARRLDHAPGDRFAQHTPTPTQDQPVVASGGSMARAAGFALPAAIIALIVYVALAGPFAFSAGLVIIAIFAGRVIGLAAKAGGGRVIASDQSVVVALVVTLGWFVVAQVAVWIYARNEGGVLSIVDYLLQVFGPIVPLVAIASVLAAWWSAR